VDHATTKPGINKKTHFCKKKAKHLWSRTAKIIAWLFGVSVLPSCSGCHWFGLRAQF
jgi:hypothetical protein